MASCVFQMLVATKGDPDWWHNVKKKSVCSSPPASMDRAPLRQPSYNWVPRWQVEQPQPDIMEAVLQGVFAGKVRASVSRSGRVLAEVNRQESCTLAYMVLVRTCVSI